MSTGPPGTEAPADGGRQGGRAVRMLGRVLYWLAVLVISLVLLIALVLFFESRDDSNLDTGAAAGQPADAAGQAGA